MRYFFRQKNEEVSQKSLFHMARKSKTLSFTRALATGFVLSGALSSTQVVQAADGYPVPSDAGVIKVTDHGATPNDGIDDTQAIRNAIQKSIDTGNRYVAPSMVYFPTGTYNISGPIESRALNTTGWSNGWISGVHLIGQSRTGVIIKLKDNAAGFTDSNNLKAVCKTGSENAFGDGENNQAFRLYFRNLTLDLGSGNYGAVGIDYVVSNRGAIKDVTIKSTDGNAAVGIKMDRSWPGPGLIKNVNIDGFRQGITMRSHYQYGMTVENVKLNRISNVGIIVENNVLAIRRLTTNISVPVARIEGGTGRIWFIDSTFSGGSGTAIINKGGVLLRNVQSTGYSTIVDEQSWGNAPSLYGGSGTTTVGEYTSDSPKSQFSPNSGKTLNLPIQETPEYNNFDFTQWANVKSYGATAWNSGDDDRAAIQAALNSGKPVVYLPNGEYHIGGTLVIPSSVRKIIGFGASLYPKVSLNPMVRFTGTDTTIVENIVLRGENNTFSIEHVSTGKLVLNHSDHTGLRTTAAGSTFIEDCMGTPYRISAGHKFWGRQVNSEFHPSPQLLNSGGTMWILNIKTEGEGTVIETRNGGATEVLGALIYPLNDAPAGTPTFIIQDSRASLAYVVNGHQWPNHVREIRNGVTKDFGNWGRGPILYVSGGTTTGTNLVSNPSFDAENYDTQTPSGWIEWSNGNYDAGYSEAFGGSRSGARHGTHWKNANYQMYTYQVKTGLANGLYTFRAWVRGGGGQIGSALVAKSYGGSDRDIVIPAASEWTQLTISDINVTNGQCEIGFWSDAYANQWIYFDDVEFFKQ